MAFYKQVTITKTIGVIVRIVCEVCGEKFIAYGNFASSGSSGSFKEAQAQKEAGDMAEKAFGKELWRQPLLYWKPCVHCGCIQSWAQKFYLKNRTAGINIYISLWYLGVCVLGFILAVAGMIFSFENVWGIASVWKVVGYVSVFVLIAALVSWLPVVIIFSIISRRRFKKRLDYWLNHPNYSGPRNPSIEFAPPRECNQWGLEVWEIGSPGIIGLALEDFREKLGVVSENEEAQSPEPVIYEVYKKEQQPACSNKSSATIFDILLDALCCVMCADGKMSPEEQNAISVILGKVVCPWSTEEIDNKIVDFLRRVKSRGSDTVIQETCERLSEFKRRGKEKVLLKCIDYMAKADGVIDEEEIKIREKFKAALDDPPPKNCTS